MTNIETVREKISALKEEHKNDASRIKYIEAFERALSVQSDSKNIVELMGTLLSGLTDWIDNPLNNNDLEISGFPRLLETIKTFDDEMFCAQDSEMTDTEVFLVANKIIDHLVDDHIDGEYLRELLNKVRGFGRDDE